ncbi:MAG: 16S rRNA (guanine(527)-N(7))-methyltransferase RsmG [Deltaproteobacteria bacterium]|nr:16S rRNA (guanine(527)-N(7))-methyltransferase RsmG [Deltaproteobacteria bacterium]
MSKNAHSDRARQQSATNAEVAPRREPPSPPESTPLLPPPGLERRLRDLGIDVAPKHLGLMGDFLARMLAMNTRMSLTAIVDPDLAWERHILDSLTLLPHLDHLEPAARVLDVGSGGGVPGVPLAIARPALSVTLLEATRKKVSYLRALTEALGLESVSVIEGRAEVLARTELAGEFVAVTARAVARLSALIPLTAPFVTSGGQLLLIKGQKAEQELSEATTALRRFELRHESTTLTPTGRILAFRKKG